MAKIFPFSGIHHYVLAAFAVVILHAHLVSDVLLGYAEFFLHSKFYRKTMGVPSGLSVHLVALHRFVSAKCVLDSACHHMVYAGMSVCRGRSFKKYVGRTVCALRDAAVEKVHLVPLGKHFHVDCWEVELTMLGECLAHICFLFLEMFYGFRSLYIHLYCMFTHTGLSVPERLSRFRVQIYGFSFVHTTSHLKMSCVFCCSCPWCLVGTEKGRKVAK